jgi:hypothetical protein
MREHLYAAAIGACAGWALACVLTLARMQPWY